MFEPLLGVNPWTALFILLNTLTIYFVAKKYLFGPVTKIISQRQQEIDGMYEDAGNAKNEAEMLRSTYQQKLSDAYSDAERILQEAVARGQVREEEIVRQANMEASAIMRKASSQIAQDKKKALDDAKNEISDMAMIIAVKVVGRELTAADHTRLVEGFISELGDEP